MLLQGLGYGITADYVHLQALGQKLLRLSESETEAYLEDQGDLVSSY